MDNDWEVEVLFVDNSVNLLLFFFFPLFDLLLYFFNVIVDYPVLVGGPQDATAQHGNMLDFDAFLDLWP